MAVIEKQIRVLGTKASKKVVALFDSGATYSCIDKTLAEKLA